MSASDVPTSFRKGFKRVVDQRRIDEIVPFVAATTMNASPPRRRRSAVIASSMLSASAMKRSSSGSSSSEINVAQAQPTPSTIAHTLPLHRNTFATDPPAQRAGASAASVFRDDGCLLLKVGFSSRPARNTLRSILDATPRPNLLRSDPQSSMHHEQNGEHDFEDGPNSNGTYSKAYKLRHPEVQWVHRGQGRYLPITSVKSEEPPMASGLVRSAFVTQAEDSSVIMEMMISALRQAFNEFRVRSNPSAREQWGSSFQHQFKLISELMQFTPRERWNEAAASIKLREHREVVQNWIRDMDHLYPETSEKDNSDDEMKSRPRRRSRAVPSIEQRRSLRLIDAPLGSANGYREQDDDDQMDASDDSLDQSKTFPKSYVDSRPSEEFYHTGNGWYKRGVRPTIIVTKQTDDRRESAKPQKATSLATDAVGLGPDDTLHRSELCNFPGRTFHHAGNGWYKTGPATNPNRPSIYIAMDGTQTTFKGPQASPDDEKDLIVPDHGGDDGFDTGMIVDKAYTLQHPEIEWVHRGNGRYKRKSSVVDTNSVTPAASSGRRSSRADTSFKDLAESIEGPPFRGSMRKKRASRTDLDLDVDTLYDKAYILEHPEDEFHHRGQGRWARGPRPKAPSSSQHTEEADSEGLVDSAYTLAHPEETFYHRGQGKWARGLPPIGSSNKVAVRGPGAKDRTDGRSMDEEDEEGNRPPGLAALVRREDGPDKWPNLKWVYRGGGKWSRTSKEELERRSRPSLMNRRSRLSTGRARQDGPEAQLQRETQAAQAERQERVQPTARRTRLVRNNSEQELPLMAESVRARAQPLVPTRAPSPRPPLLAPEDDRLTDEDLPSLYKESWSSDDDEDASDEAARILRTQYSPIIGPDSFVKALTRYDPAVRSLATLKQLAVNAQSALKQLQDEFLEIDKLVAQNPMHGKKERKPLKGGRQPVETTVFEDKKEAMLYDYVYDPRRNGYQNPDAQRIIRDAEGRELRRRRGRNHVPDVSSDPHAVNIFNDVEELTSKRVVKPVSRFDGLTTQPPRKKSRLALASDAEADFKLLTASAASLAADAIESQTPSRTGTPITKLSVADLVLAADEYKAPTRGRWKNHIPKRIRELRGESVGSTSARSASEGAASPGPSPAGTSSGTRDKTFKSQASGSKNDHTRRDAGIRKGPRRPKISSKHAEGSVEPESAATSMESTPAPDDAELADEEYVDDDDAMDVDLVTAEDGLFGR